MAILEQIRNRAGLMVGFVGVALAAFVLGDALQNGNTWFSANQRVVLSVDGEETNIEDYERRLQVLSEQAQQQTGGQLTDEQRMNINNSLTQQIIAQHVLDKLAKQIGLKVTADEVYALLNAGQGITPSPLAQQFFGSLGVDINDSKAVNELIKQLSDASINALPAEQQRGMRMVQAQWQSLQENIALTRLQQKVQALLSRSYKVTKLDQELATQGGARSVALVRTTPTSADKASEPTADDIKKYYESHKNFFISQEPSVDLSYISAQVTPSSEDYKAAEAKVQKALADLESATSENISDVLRNHGASYQPIYFTGAELDQMGLGAGETDFIKSASVGATHNTGLVYDKYTLVKLVGKKNAAESLGLQIILLDSVMSKKSDSVMLQLKGGASFESLVEKYSQDPQTKANGGRLSQQGQYGIPMDSFTEAQLVGSPFANLFEKPVGEAFVVDNGPMKIIARSVDPKPATDKYQIAVLPIEANFSEKTYNAKFDALNRILGAGGKFEDMAKKAEKEGFNVVRSQVVSTSAPQLGAIPSSRQLVSWALNAEEGAITDKVHRVGTDYLVIASANKQYEAGIMPLAQVSEQIAARLSAEKRASSLATSLGSKALTSLEAYATEMNAQVDTIRGVSYAVRGEHPAIGAKAMTTAIGQLSKPFVAGTEVVVLQPTAKEEVNAAEQAAQTKQAEQGLGYQLASRVFQNLLQGSKVVDNRARFY